VRPTQRLAQVREILPQDLGEQLAAAGTAGRWRRSTDPLAPPSVFDDVRRRQVRGLWVDVGRLRQWGVIAVPSRAVSPIITITRV